MSERHPPLILRNSTGAPACRWETPAEEIGRLCKEITEISIRAGKDALTKAIRIGELLLEQKAKIPHGGWLPWLEETFPYSESTAQNWMGLSRKHKANPQQNGDLGLTDAKKCCLYTQRRLKQPSPEPTMKTTVDPTPIWVIGSTMKGRL
jgi:hypothetical protein